MVVYGTAYLMRSRTFALLLAAAACAATSGYPAVGNALAIVVMLLGLWTLIRVHVRSRPRGEQ